MYFGFGCMGFSLPRRKPRVSEIFVQIWKLAEFPTFSAPESLGSQLGGNFDQFFLGKCQNYFHYKRDDWFWHFILRVGYFFCQTMYQPPMPSHAMPRFKEHIGRLGWQGLARKLWLFCPALGLPRQRRAGLNMKTGACARRARMAYIGIFYGTIAILVRIYVVLSALKHGCILNKTTGISSHRWYALCSCDPGKNFPFLLYFAEWHDTPICSERSKTSA